MIRSCFFPAVCQMTRKTGLIQLEPATTLDDVYKTMSPEPLMTPPEIQAFYRGGLKEVRGGDKVGAMALGLDRSWGRASTRRSSWAIPGVGKSTELTRLVERVSTRFRAIRFQVTKRTRPGSFKPFDVLLLMMIRVVEETGKPVSEGGAGPAPSEGCSREVETWFAKEEATVTESRNTEIEARAGIGHRPIRSGTRCSASSQPQGRIQYAADRSIKKVEYRLERLSALIELVNKLLNECNDCCARPRDANGCSSARNSIGPPSARPRRGSLLESCEHHSRNPGECRSSRSRSAWPIPRSRRNCLARETGSNHPGHTGLRPRAQGVQGGGRAAGDPRGEGLAKLFGPVR